MSIKDFDTTAITEENLKELKKKFRERINEIQLMIKPEAIAITLSAKTSSKENDTDPWIIIGHKNGLTGELSLEVTPEGFMELPESVRNRIGYDTLTRPIPLPLDEELAQALAEIMGLEEKKEFNDFFENLMSNQSLTSFDQLNEKRLQHVDKLQKNIDEIEKKMTNDKKNESKSNKQEVLTPTKTPTVEVKKEENFVKS